MDHSSLFSELGLDALPEEDQVVIAEKMTEALLKRVIAELLDELTEEQIAEFDNLPEDSSPEDFESFFRNRVTNYDAQIERIVEEFKEEIRSELANLIEDR